MLGKFSVRKPYTVLVAVILVIVLGVVSFTRMSTDLLPSISLPYVIVMTPYPGASPETVEMVVTKPVEASMATVSNIEGISSVSSENYSTVILEFAQSTDMNAASLEIRENLDQIRSYWDDSVGSPIIMKLNPDMLPIMIAAVGNTGMTDAQVSDMTQNVVIPELESIEGVASASATGLFEESVNVIIRQEKIDTINKQVFAYIDDEMKDAEQELADGKQEVYDGQAELAKARAELEDSKQELVDGQQELDDNSAELEESKQKLADGKAEIAENKAKLEEGKSELANKKGETTAQLAAAETKILTAKTELESTKMHLTLEIATAEATIEAAQSGIDQIDEGIKKYNEAKQAVESINSLITALDQAPSQDIPVELVLTGEQQAAIAQLLQMSVDDVSGMTVGMLKAALLTARDSMNAALEAMGGDEGVAALESQKAELTATAEMQKAAVAAMKAQLSTIEQNISSLDKALEELYAGNLTAAIEFANAQTTISVGEMQLTAAETQLEASEKQLEAGEEQLKAGREQLDSAWEQIRDGEEQLNDSAEQLKDALQQILDGEEELEEAREDAYDQADMNDILTVDTVKSLLAAQNFSMPAGYVTEEGIDYLVRVGDKPEDIEELKKMPLLNPEMDGVEIITLEDVADVFMTDNSEDNDPEADGIFYRRCFRQDSGQI